MTHGPNPFDRVFTQSRDVLVRILTARVGNRADAEDICQEAFLRCCRREGLDTVENPRAYLIKVALNVANDMAREVRRARARDRAWTETHVVDVGGTAVDQTAPPDLALAAQQDVARLAAAVEALPPAVKRVFVLHKLRDLPHAEVARLTGIARSTVEKHMIKALRLLTKRLSE